MLGQRDPGRAARIVTRNTVQIALLPDAKPPETGNIDPGNAESPSAHHYRFCRRALLSPVGCLWVPPCTAPRPPAGIAGSTLVIKYAERACSHHLVCFKLLHQVRLSRAWGRWWRLWLNCWQCRDTGLGVVKVWALQWLNGQWGYQGGCLFWWDVCLR